MLSTLDVPEHLQLGGRLLTASCPCWFILAVGWFLLKKLKGCRDTPLARQVKPVVIPYVHNTSHNLKKIVARHSVPVVFSAPMKLSALVPPLYWQVHERRNSNQYKELYYGSPATFGGVYKLCGSSDLALLWKGLHIGKMARCLNVRLREHHSSLKVTLSGHLA